MPVRFRVCRIREKVMSKVNRNVDLFDEIDIKRLLTDDYQIERFIIEYETEDTAFDTLVKALLWKKEFGVYDRTEDYFFREIYEIYLAEIYGRDKQGRYIIWANDRAKNAPYIREFIGLFKKSTITMVEIFDQRGHETGFTQVINAHGSEKSEIGKLASLEMIKFIMDLKNYYPLYSRCIIMVDMPKVHKALSKLVLALLNKKMRNTIHFINRDQLTDFIDHDLIPKFLGGPRMTMLHIADNVKPYRELDYFNFSDKSIEKFFKHYDKEMNNKIEI